MVKKTTKKATPKKRNAKTTKVTATRSKRAGRTTVDYYPNRMGLAVAALSAVTLLLFGMIAMMNS